MTRRLTVPLALSGLLATAGAAGALVHHGWGEYDSSRTLNLVGTVEAVRYVNPHVLIDLRVADASAQTWKSVLAPPARMRARGLPDEALRPGMTARVVGYPHKRTKQEMRAERIIIGNDTTELR